MSWINKLWIRMLTMTSLTKEYPAISTTPLHVAAQRRQSACNYFNNTSHSNNNQGLHREFTNSSIHLFSPIHEVSQVHPHCTCGHKSRHQNPINKTVNLFSDGSAQWRPLWGSQAQHKRSKESKKPYSMCGIGC